MTLNPTSKLSYSLFLLLMIPFIISCSGDKADDKDKNIDIILNGYDYKVWQFKPKKDTLNYAFFYFDNKGNCINMGITNERKFRKYSYGDVVVSNTWDISNDSLNFVTLRCKILKHSRDTILLYDYFLYNDTIYLIDIGLPPKLK